MNTDCEECKRYAALLAKCKNRQAKAQLVKDHAEHVKLHHGHYHTEIVVFYDDMEIRTQREYAPEP